MVPVPRKDVPAQRRGPIRRHLVIPSQEPRRMTASKCPYGKVVLGQTSTVHGSWAAPLPAWPLANLTSKAMVQEDDVRRSQILFPFKMFGPGCRVRAVRRCTPLLALHSTRQSYLVRSKSRSMDLSCCILTCPYCICIAHRTAVAHLKNRYDSRSRRPPSFVGSDRSFKEALLLNASSSIN